MARKRTLTKEKVLRQAVELANEAGSVEQVTLANLAASLAIRTPSLYNHVAGSDGLIRDLRLLALEEMRQQLAAALVGHTGKAAVSAMAHAYRAYALAQPALYPLTLAAPPDDDREWQRLSQELVNLVVLVLASVGLQGDDAIHAARAFRSGLHGFVSLELHGGFGLPQALDTSFERVVALFDFRPNDAPHS